MTVQIFEAHRGRLVAIAYGMLGSVMDAEDIVQDAYLRWSALDAAAIRSPEAYLTTMVTRLSIDRLRSAQRRREHYVGPWLPDPIVAADEDPADVVATAEHLSMAMMVTLERLNPIERAVFLLRDVFDFDYDEIADVVDKSPANCRQIAARARQRVGDPSRSRPLDDVARGLVETYANAILAGDVDALASILAEDVVLWSDGGGRTRAALHPLAGRERVAKYLVGVARNAPDGVTAQLMRINGELGWLAWDGADPVAAISFEIDEGVVIGLRIVLNPDKLGHLRERRAGPATREG